MIKLTTTKDVVKNGVKVLVYGPAGIGKTVLCSTAPDPLIISAEGGLLSLADTDIPVFEISTREDCNEVYEWLTKSKEADKFQTVCIDSLSEIAEVLLSAEMGETKDARQAYGVMADEMSTLVRGFRDLKGKHVYFSCKQKRLEDPGSNFTSYMPSVPGQTFLQSLPYLFDELFCMRLGKTQEGVAYRYLQTSPDLQYVAKDRSGVLSGIEEPNLTKVFNTILTNIKGSTD